jgi:hypothetical protein
VRLASTPEMADYDKLSWLMLSRAPDGLARNDTALAALVRRLRTQRQQHHRHLATGLSRRATLHAARAVGQRQLARCDLDVAVELSVIGRPCLG